MPPLAACSRRSIDLAIEVKVDALLLAISKQASTKSPAESRADRKYSIT
jgi:hypothetical protein